MIDQSQFRKIRRVAKIFCSVNYSNIMITETYNTIFYVFVYTTYVRSYIVFFVFLCSCPLWERSTARKTRTLLQNDIWELSQAKAGT